MRLRKYAEGRILGEARCNWVQRQIAFPLPGPESSTATWLLLDCKRGPAITAGLPDGFGEEPAWPPVSDIAALVRETDEPELWERFPVLTPLLRRTLALLPPQEAAALLVDLETGCGDLFWYGLPAKDRMVPQSVSAWPLPPGLDERKGLVETVTDANPQAVLPLLERLQMPLLLAEAEAAAVTPAVKRDKAASKRRKRLLEKLENEKSRMAAMLRLGDDARLLQAYLWRLPPDAQRESICLPVNPENPDGECRTISLNPLVSVTENMRIMFRKSAKAARGLSMLDKRIALAGEIPPSRAEPERPLAGQPGKKSVKKPLFSPSLIQEFVSSDGFSLWRGRSAEGNRALLKLARPFDLWFHVEDGPSAHLLVRRDHGGQEVPERTLREGAVLVGLKSWRRNDPKAPVMIALAKHVQPVKGGAAGTVRVQELLRTILVSLDETMEQTLRPAQKGTPCTTRK
ncbi:MAG: NFACT RNA binding domain-containing protein [Deltaproteobacteria bacterium]|nr:NFACT RNA binding domain-containing protein [Deltaproteobacteria bacterium]